MKKRIVIPVSVLIVLILVALILFLPFPSGVYDDGGTREFKSLTYKIVAWNKNLDDGTYHKTSVYWGSDKRKNINELWRMEIADNPNILY